MTSEILICAAGGGKTTRIVDKAVATTAEQCAMITYTLNNVGEILQKLYDRSAATPAHIEVWPWYTFLLRELARPYQRALISWRIEGIHWAKGKSAKFAREDDISAFYFNDKLIYSDKIAKFICECDKVSGGAVMQRLKQRFDRIYIDEVQDMVGYDLDLLERMLRSNVKLTLVGDHRQATLRTNNSSKNRGMSGILVVKKFADWKGGKLCSVSYETHTYRCQQSIVDLADTLFPGEPATVSKNKERTGHDGIFWLPANEVGAYMERYSPQVLRRSVTTDCMGYRAINYGASKGMTFKRVLIFPHKLAEKWLVSGDISHVAGSAALLYVGITRARHSVAFVCAGPAVVKGAQRVDLSLPSVAHAECLRD